MVVSELSRLGRSLGQIVTILDALAEARVAFVALKENIWVEGKRDRGRGAGSRCSQESRSSASPAASPPRRTARTPSSGKIWRVRGELAQELARPRGPGRHRGRHPQDVRPVAVDQVHVHLAADQRAQALRDARAFEHVEALRWQIPAGGNTAVSQRR